MKTKQEIRKKILEKRKNLDIEFIRKFSFEIIKKLKDLKEYQEANNILFYVSAKNEVDTIFLIKELLQNRQKNVLVPYLSDEKIKLSKLNNFLDLEPGSFGIPEPKKEKIIGFDKEKLDLIIVPGISFDSKGNRCGYGYSYYDRFLNSIQKKVIKIGLCYDFQLIDKVPCEDHDIPVDIVITENEIIKI